MKTPKHSCCDKCSAIEIVPGEYKIPVCANPACECHKELATSNKPCGNCHKDHKGETYCQEPTTGQDYAGPSGGSGGIGSYQRGGGGGGVASFPITQLVCDCSKPQVVKGNGGPGLVGSGSASLPITQTACRCPTKHCKHYESDFDRFVKETDWSEVEKEFDELSKYWVTKSVRISVKDFFRTHLEAEGQKAYWEGVKVMEEEADRALEVVRQQAREEIFHPLKFFPPLTDEDIQGHAGMKFAFEAGLEAGLKEALGLVREEPQYSTRLPALVEKDAITNALEERMK